MSQNLHGLELFWSKIGCERRFHLIDYQVRRVRANQRALTAVGEASTLMLCALLLPRPILDLPLRQCGR